MLSTDNRVKMQHIKHANKYFEQSSNSQIFNNYKSGSHPDPSIGLITDLPQTFSLNIFC